MTGQPLPFLDSPIARLENRQTPGAFDEHWAQPPVAVFVNRTLEATVAGGVLAWTQSGVTGHLAAVLEAVPIGDFPVEDFAG